MTSVCFLLCFLAVSLVAHGAEDQFCAGRLDHVSSEAWPKLNDLRTTQPELSALLRADEEFDHHVSTTLRMWEMSLRRTLGHGFVYRGMALSAEQLGLILKQGLVVERSGHDGIFYSTEPAEAMSYAYKRLAAPGLAVILVLEYDAPTIFGRSTMTTEDIPPEAIGAVLIFNPRRGQAFPFEVLKRSANGLLSLRGWSLAR